MCPSVCVPLSVLAALLWSPPRRGDPTPVAPPCLHPLWLCPGAVLAASPRAELRPGSPDVVPAEGGPPLFFLGGGYCSPGKYVYVHAVAMYILLSVDNVLIQMNWREMAICLIQLI